MNFKFTSKSSSFFSDESIETDKKIARQGYDFVSDRFVDRSELYRGSTRKKRKGKRDVSRFENRVGTENCLEKRAIIPVPCRHDENREITIKTRVRTKPKQKIVRVHERFGNRWKIRKLIYSIAEQRLWTHSLFFLFLPAFFFFFYSSSFGFACQTV